MAFSYAVLPFTFKGKTKFAQISNYIYYDRISESSQNLAWKAVAKAFHQK